MSEDFELTTDRLLLRSYRTADAERIQTYSADETFSQYEIWGPNTEEDTRNYVAEMVEQSRTTPRYKFDCVVCLKDSQVLVGSCGLRRDAERSRVGNLGWAIDPAHQGRGIATEAARALIAHGFDQLGLVVIYATCDVRNVASYRVMEKLGLTRVGCIKGTRIVKGHVRDIYRYEIVPPVR